MREMQFTRDLERNIENLEAKLGATSAVVERVKTNLIVKKDIVETREKMHGSEKTKRQIMIH